MLKHVRFQLEELWHHGHERFQRHLGGDQHQRLRGHFSRGAWDLVGWICCDIPFVGKVNKKHRWIHGCHGSLLKAQGNVKRLNPRGSKVGLTCTLAMVLAVQMMLLAMAT